MSTAQKHFQNTLTKYNGTDDAFREVLRAALDAAPDGPESLAKVIIHELNLSPVKFKEWIKNPKTTWSPGIKASAIRVIQRQLPP